MVVNQQNIGTIKKHKSEKHKDYYLQKANGERLYFESWECIKEKILILMMMTVKCYYFYF